MDIQFRTARSLEDCPDELISFLNRSFPYIKDRKSFNDYFFAKTVIPPYINWVVIDGKIMGHLTLFEIPFVLAGTKILAGKPELDMVSLELARYCLDRKIDYKELNLMGKLNELVKKQAQEDGLKFLFSWPNSLAVSSCVRDGYTVYPIMQKLYLRVDDPKYLFKHKIKTSFLVKLLGFIWWLVSWRPKNWFKLEKIEKFDIDLPLGNTKKIYPFKDSFLLNKRYAHPKFDKYYLKSRCKVVGYLVVKQDEEEGLQKIIDFSGESKYFYLAIANLPVKQKAVLFRHYETDDLRVSPLGMFLAGYIPYKKQKRDFVFLDLANILFNKKEMCINDFISDYSG